MPGLLLNLPPEELVEAIPKRHEAGLPLSEDGGLFILDGNQGRSSDQPGVRRPSPDVVELEDLLVIHRPLDAFHLGPLGGNGVGALEPR